MSSVIEIGFIGDVRSATVELLLSVAAFFVVAYFVLVLTEDRAERLRSAIDRYVSVTERPNQRSTASAGSFWNRAIVPGYASLAALLSSTAPQKMWEEASKQLVMAGNPMGVSTFLALRAIIFIGFPLLFVAFTIESSQQWDATRFLLLAILVVSARALPTTLLKLRINARQKNLERSMPDVLDLLVACVESGLSLDGALMKVTDRTTGPLSEEINRAVYEMSMGRSRRDALRDLAGRTGVQSIQSFSQTIAHAEQMGVSIADALRVLADNLRTKRRLKAQEMAQKVPLKMIPVVIFFIMPALFIVLIGPAVISITQIFGG